LPTDAVALSGKITSVKGTVQVRSRENGGWKPAAVGMPVDQGTEIRTGLRSAVQFVVGNDQTITLDRLGTVTVLQAFQSQGKAKTDLGLKYGRARYDIQHTDLEHESTIRSPGSTLAIRGTDVIYEDQAPWVPTAISNTGRAEFRNYRRQFLAFGGTRRAQVAADKNSTAETAYSNAKTDPKGAYAGRTAAEDQLNLTLQSIGGADARKQETARAFSTGFEGKNANIGFPKVPGPVRLNVTWSSVAEGLPSNLDLTVTITDLLGNTSVVNAANPTVGSGSVLGTHSGDDKGVAGLGSEEVFFGQFFPTGTYRMDVAHNGGAPANTRILVSVGGSVDTKPREIKRIGFDPKAPLILQPGQSVSTTVKIRSK
jgi:hypothetical protein